MRYFIIVILIFMFCGIAEAAPTVTSTSGTLENGLTIIVGGTDFGSHADNDAGGQDYLSFRYEDYEDGTFANILTGSNGTGMDLTTSNQRHVFSSYSVQRDTTQNTAAGISMSSNSSTSEYYTSFWVYLRNISSWSSNGFKLTRQYADVDGGSPNFFHAISSVADGDSFGNVIERVHETPTTSQVTTSGVQAKIGDNNWRRIETYVKMSSGLGVADGITKLWVDGELIHSKTDLLTDDEGDGGVADINTLPGRWMILPFFDAVDKSTTDVDEIVMDYTLARVELGNDPVFADCTHREYQPVTAWSTTETTIEFNQGTFSNGDTVYLFVIDSDGNASDGLRVTVGSRTIHSGINGSVTIKGAVTITP